MKDSGSIKVTKLEIETKTFVRFALVVLGFTAMVYFVTRIWSAIIIIIVAFLLSLALNPPVSRIARRLKGNSRVGATALAFIMVVSLLGAALFLLVPPIIEQSAHFVKTVPSLIDNVSQNRTWLDDFLERYQLKSEVDNGLLQLKGRISDLAANLGNTVVAGVSGFFSGVVTIAFILVLSFLMLIEGPSWMRRFWSLYQDEAKLNRHQELARKMYRVVSGYVNGQILVAMIAAAGTTIVMIILSQFFNVPLNLAIAAGVAVFVTGLVPMVGATIGAVIVGLLLALNDVTAAVIFVIYFVIYQQIENNVISPTIQARTVEVSALMILVAILIGVSFFGLVGGLIAIPVAGCVRVLVLDYIDHRSQQSRKKAA